MSTKRILLAESNPLYRQAIAEVLTQIQGIKLVDKVGTGWEVVQLSAQLKPDIILMDFNLPGLNGLEAARLIKQQLAYVPIVILIDDENEQYINAVKQSGAFAYIAKSKLAHELPSLLYKLSQADRVGACTKKDVLPEH
jgi:DNA-binding NarL/FixJ family response regulator